MPLRFRPHPLHLALLMLGAPILAPSVLATEAPTTLAPVPVTGQREAQVQRKNNAIQKIIIAEDELERFGDVSVGDILKRMPGMSFTGPAGVVKDIRLRGLDKGYTQFLINGEPVPSATKERQLQVDRLPADMIERIEIIRSPSAEYESGSVGGVVNIVLKQRIDESTRTRLAYGKNGNKDVGDAIVQTSKRIGDVDVLLALSYTQGGEDIIEEKDTINPSTGKQTSSDYKPKPVKKTEWLFTPRLSWQRDDHKLTLEPFISKGTEDKTEHTTSASSTGAVSSRAHATENKDDTVGRLAARYDGKFSQGDWYVKGSTQKTTSEKDKITWTSSYNTSTDAYTGAKRATEYEKLEESQHAAGVGFSMPLGASQRLQAGLEWRETEYSSRKPKTEQSWNTAGVAGTVSDKSGVRDRFDITERKLMAFVQHEVTLAQSHWLTPGLRYEYTERQVSGVNSTQNAANPSLHYRWAALDNLNVRASVARTLKLPKFDQLNPLIESKSGTLSDPDKGGNVALNPERSLGLDAGVEYFFMGNRAVVGANLYQRQVKNYIEERSGLEGKRYVKRPYNIGDARFWGLELDWRVPVLEKTGHVLNLVGNHAEMRGEIDSPSKGQIDVKELPPRVSNFGLDYRHRPSRTFAGLSVNYVPDYTAKSTNDDGAIEEKTWGARTGLDLYVGKAFSPLAELRFVARNVLSVTKKERTIKRDEKTGAISSHEYKEERSKPTFMVTFESRF